MNNTFDELLNYYQKKAARLLKQIEQREQIAVLLKTAAPERRQKIREALFVLDKLIDKFETTLAEDYESLQRIAALKKESEKHWSELWEDAKMVEERMYIYLKHREPEKLANFKKMILDGRTPEEIENFYDRTTVREATQLEEILTESKQKQ